MAIIKFENFTGIAPRIDPKKLPDGGAQHADGCLFEAGDLRALRAPSTAAWGGVAPSGAMTIHPWKDRWLAWSEQVDVVNSPVVQDQWERIYWTVDEGLPRYAANTTLQSATQMSGLGAVLGIDRPTQSPTVQLGSTVEPEVLAQTLSRTSPVRVATSTDHPFEDGQRVIVVLTKAGGAGSGVPDAPPDRTGMVEIVGKTYTVKAIRDSTSGITDRRQFDLIGADGINFSEYNPSRWVATVRRVYSDTDRESRSYVYTYVSGSYKEESQPSDPSEVVDVLKGADVMVSGFSVTSTHITNGYTIRLYRSVTGTSGTSFFFVKEVQAASGMTITDDVPFERIGEVLPSETWAKPATGLTGLTAMPGGFLVAFKGNTLHFSEPYMPHAWPVQYRRTVQDAIIGIGVYGQTLVVATRGKPYLASGADPASVSLQQLDDYAPCLNRQCLTSTGTGVIYPTLGGLVHVSASGVRRLTESYYTSDQWSSFFVQSKCAIWHDGRYVASVGGRIAMFQPEGNGVHISTFTGYSPSAFAISKRVMPGNIPRDTLLFAQGSNLYTFNRGGSRVDAKWVSKVVSLPRPVSLACGQVYADSYPVTIRLHAARLGETGQPASLTYGSNDPNSYEVSVQGPEPFRLPGGFVSREWRVDIVTARAVQAVYLASSMDEIKQV